MREMPKRMPKRICNDNDNDNDNDHDHDNELAGDQSPLLQLAHHHDCAAMMAVASSAGMATGASDNSYASGLPTSAS